MTGAFVWISTWLILIAVFVVLAQSRWGKTIVYYALWMLLLVLVLSHGKDFTKLINVQALSLNG